MERFNYPTKLLLTIKEQSAESYIVLMCCQSFYWLQLYKFYVIYLLIILLQTGNHTVAVIKGQESYELLQTSCATVFKQDNEIIKEGKVSIDGRDIPVELFLGGDYKVLMKHKVTWLSSLSAKLHNWIINAALSKLCHWPHLGMC